MISRSIKLNAVEARRFAEAARRHAIEEYGPEDVSVLYCEDIINLEMASTTFNIDADVFAISVCAAHMKDNNGLIPMPEMQADDLKGLVKFILSYIHDDDPNGEASRAACNKLVSLCDRATTPTIQVPSDVFVDATMALTWPLPEEPEEPISQSEEN